MKTTRVSGRTRVFETSREVLGTAEARERSRIFYMACGPCRLEMDFQVGYSRSVGYDLNTLFFGVGFSIGN